MPAQTIDHYRPQLEAALVYSGGTHTFDDIAAGVASGELQCWPGPRSAIVTAVEHYPRQRRLLFFLAGGDLAEIEAMTPAILDWGRAQGCSTAAFVGRRGWERTFLTRTGWEAQPLVVLEKVL